jgi:hypothetical protein
MTENYWSVKILYELIHSVYINFFFKKMFKMNWILNRCNYYMKFIKIYDKYI